MPVYAAFEIGAFSQEELDLDYGAVPPGEDVGQLLRSGAAHVVLGGPMRVIVDHDKVHGSDLVCFAEVVTRDPFFLVGRNLSLARSVARYQSLVLWSTSPLLPPLGFERQMDGLLSAGLVTRTLDYAEVINMSFADDAVARPD
ncbi:ABC transporter substrate-binding protein [Lutibaculum baratangense]|nr:ABC transporter substrate-binding protein [Lutibaculum baratangense]